VSPRLSPLVPSDWPVEMRDALAALHPATPRQPLPEPRGDGPKALNLLGTFARHPDLTRAYHTFVGHLLFASTLAPRDRELLVLRVAAVRGADYEWAQHAVIAADVGLTEEEVARVAAGPDADEWRDHDRALLRAVDQLVADARIDEATWMQLAATLDDQQLLDLIFTVGCYETLAMVLRSVDVELDADLADVVRPSAD
jgi:alkylhydroperoxidase family enzyme